VKQELACQLFCYFRETVVGAGRLPLAPDQRVSAIESGIADRTG